MLFNNNDWKLSVTDINLYDNTVSLDGQSHPLSLAIKTLIPGYLSGLTVHQPRGDGVTGSSG